MGIPLYEEYQEPNVLDKYYLLVPQQHSLREQLSNFPTPSPSSSSPSVATLHADSAPSSPAASPLPTSPIECTASLDDEALIEDKLFQINQEVSDTLTELLHSDAFDMDENFREWAQNRLKETQLELKEQRKRRGSTDEDVLEVVEEGVEEDEHINVVDLSPAWFAWHRMPCTHTGPGA